MIANRLVAACEQRHQVEAVLACIVREFGAERSGNGGHNVGLVHKLIGNAPRLRDARPAHDEGHAMTAFPGVRFVSA